MPSRFLAAIAEAGIPWKNRTPSEHLISLIFWSVLKFIISAFAPRWWQCPVLSAGLLYCLCHRLHLAHGANGYIQDALLRLSAMCCALYTAFMKGMVFQDQFSRERVHPPYKSVNQPCYLDDFIKLEIPGRVHAWLTKACVGLWSIQEGRERIEMSHWQKDMREWLLTSVGWYAQIHMKKNKEIQSV